MNKGFYVWVLGVPLARVGCLGKKDGGLSGGTDVANVDKSVRRKRDF